MFENPTYFFIRESEFYKIYDSESFGTPFLDFWREKYGLAIVTLSRMIVTKEFKPVQCVIVINESKSSIFILKNANIISNNAYIIAVYGNDETINKDNIEEYLLEISIKGYKNGLYLRN